MNITIYALNNWILYLIDLHKGFISLIMSIAVQLDYSHGNRSRPIEVGP